MDAWTNDRQPPLRDAKAHPKTRKTDLIFILVTNLSVGGSSGYFSPQTTLIWYMRFSKGVRGGPMIIPFHRDNDMSSSSSKPHEIVPSPAP